MTPDGPSPRRRACWLAATASIALSCAPGCARHRAHESEPAPLGSTPEGDAPAPPGDASGAVVLDMVRGLDACEFGHDGVLLDFGDPSVRGDVRPGFVGPQDEEVVEHGGATWVRVRARTLSAAFYWPAAAAGQAPDANAYVEARIRGATARAVAVSIDGKSVGSWSLTRGEVRTLVARAPAPVTLAAGGHELGMRFIGGSRGGDVLAELDWAHVGTGDPAAGYAAPTRGDVLVDGAVGGRSMRALSLHAPGFVRCSGWLPADATLDTWLATAGGGDADVEAHLLRDRQPPVLLGTAHVAGGAASWASWSVPVTGLDGEGALASIDLTVRRAAPSTRVLFGAPRVLVAEHARASAHPPARGVVLVVLGSTSAKTLAPWGGPHAVPELASLATSGAVFASNRASSALSNAVLAAMLTGLSPLALGIEDADARLPRGPTTIAEACRQAGVATAMFTANPMTSAAFGFDRGWDSFVAHDPLDDAPGTRVFDDAAAWIDAHKGDPFFVVVHARGGHPPWDATLDELKSMPPAGYLGILEPHRAAEVMAKARKHPGHFKDEDRVRAWALYDRAVDAHDAALGRLVAALRSAGRGDDTAVIVTGDVAPSDAPPVPLFDDDQLDEPLLATPLVVHWPGDDALAGRRVEAPTEPEDIARTALAALGLVAPSTYGGVDLLDAVRGTLIPAVRPLAATCGDRFSVRWGPYVLIGGKERESRMCDLSLDPTCVADVRATSPLALEPLRRWARDTLAPADDHRFARVGAQLDAHTTAALVRWGRLTGDDRSDDARGGGDGE